MHSTAHAQDRACYYIQYYVRNRAITVILGLDVDIGIRNGESESAFMNSVVLVTYLIEIWNRRVNSVVLDYN